MKNRASDLRSSLRSLGKAGACAALAFICLGACPGQTQDAAIQASPQPAGDLIAGLYGLVSSTGGKLPDWDMVRACFLKEAVIVLRTSRTTTTVFSLEGFIKDFVDFYQRPFKRGEMSVLPKDSGFTERVLRMKSWEYGDMAHVLVLYEAKITGFPMLPQQGVDSWLLIRRDGRWLIAAATNELVTPERPVPPELRVDVQKSTGSPVSDLAALKSQLELAAGAATRLGRLKSRSEIPWEPHGASRSDVARRQKQSPDAFLFAPRGYAGGHSADLCPARKSHNACGTPICPIAEQLA